MRFRARQITPALAMAVIAGYAKADHRVRATRPIESKPAPARNRPCSCGSGKKFKHCHGHPDGPPAQRAAAEREVEELGELIEADGGGSGDEIKIEAAAGDIVVTASKDADALPTFRMVAYTGGRQNVKNFPVPVVMDVKGVSFSANGLPPALYHHSMKDNVGHTTRVAVEGHQIIAEGVLSGTGPKARQVLDDAKNGYRWQASPGYFVRPDDLEFFPKGKTIRVNGQSFEGPVLVAWKTKVREFSFVGIGADESTSVRVAAEASLEVSEMTFAEFVEAQGLEETNLSDTLRATLKRSYELEVEAAGEDDDEDDLEPSPQAKRKTKPVAPARKGTKPIKVDASADDDADEEDPVLEHRRRMAAERRRTDEVIRICAEYGNPKRKIKGQEISIEAMAIEEGWDLKTTELEAIKASRGTAPAGHSGSTRSALFNADVLAAGIMLNCEGAGSGRDEGEELSGFQLDSKALHDGKARSRGIAPWLAGGPNSERFQQTVEAAGRVRGMSFIDICRHGLAADGRQDAFHAPQHEVIEASFSSTTLSNVFTQNVTAQVLDAFRELGDNTAGLCSENGTIANYLPQERVRTLLGGDDLEALGENGEARDATLSDKKETYQIDRFAKKFSLDEIAIQNDNLQVFAEMPRRMGRAANRIKPRLIFGLLLSNPTMADGMTVFHEDRGNYLEGAIDAAGIKAAQIAMRKMKEGLSTDPEEDKVELDLMPDTLWCSIEKVFDFETLIRSAQVVGSSSQPDRNPIHNIVANIRSDQRLSQAWRHPLTKQVLEGLATDYYLLDSRNPPIEYGTLRGTNGAPRIRSGQYTNGRFGQWWDVQYAAGAAFLEAITIIKVVAAYPE
jgi:hypothetical protein